MRFFEASPWRFPSLLHARGETTGAATQRSTPSVLHFRTGVRIPPPPDFARLRRASAWQASPCQAKSVTPKRRSREGGRPPACTLTGRSSSWQASPCQAKSVTPKRRSREGGPSTLRAIAPFTQQIRCGCCTRDRMISSLHVVYVLESVSEPARHYTGLSSSAVERLVWHNAGPSGHTAKHRPWKLLVSIEFADAASALRFEKYLKTGSGRAFAKRHFGAG